MYQEVLDFWFTEIKPKQWWVKDETFDQLIRSRFLNLHQQGNSLLFGPYLRVYP